MSASTSTRANHVSNKRYSFSSKGQYQSVTNENICNDNNDSSSSNVKINKYSEKQQQ